MNKIVEIIKAKPLDSVVKNVTSLIKKKVAAYARVSTDYEDQLNSYTAQCNEYSSSISSNPQYIFVGIFADKGISGTQAKKRPEFMKMIELAKNGDIDLIITKSISRFGRNTVDVITYIRELREINVEIFFEKENISSLDPKIDFMLTILSSIAQEESRAISTNVKWAYDKKFKNGIVDPRRIFGYDVSDGKQVINPSEALVVKQIFTLALKHYNINDIVKTLNSEGIKTLKGSAWSYGSVRFILGNEKYIGDAILRKTVCIDYLTKKTVKNNNIADKYYVSNNHEAIIDKEMFQSVQIILSNKSANIRNANKTTKYPLTGILFCSKCGRSLKRQHTVHGKSKIVMLNCNHSYGNDFICKTSSPKYDLALGAVNESVNELHTNQSVLNTLFTILDNNVASNDIRYQIEKLKNDNKQLYSILKEVQDELKVIDQVNHNTSLLEKLEKQLSENLSVSIRLEYIKSLVNVKQLSTIINFKDIYTLILANEQKVSLVISTNHSVSQLLNEIPKVLETESVLSKLHISKDEKNCIFFEVIVYE